VAGVSYVSTASESAGLSTLSSTEIIDMIARAAVVLSVAACVTSVALASRAFEAVTVYYSTAAKTKEVGRKTTGCNNEVEMDGKATKFTKNIRGAKCPNNG